MAVRGGLVNSCEKKRGEKQRKSGNLSQPEDPTEPWQLDVIQCSGWDPRIKKGYEGEGVKSQ